ncbi:hypothetical protein [Silvanigrella aquatica]|uniref:DNA polymerase III subunit delta n=1 Tax=Silvanigrella aquatica TaxID=1915309 RepID=A0A1L4D1A2_9BACT|nr:hypothetical protein [Silvanigrella aquatica]APJ03983.1 hypothetical protein AXG55_08710 [Silvanigrella aquatica]
MNSFQEFITKINDYKHHALLLVSKQFENAEFPPAQFYTLIKEICGIALYQNNDVSVFEMAAQHHDIFIADRHRKILRIEDLEKIKDLVLYQPSEAKRRLFFIENCERMNANSANALLKALEEPHAKSIFILTTRNLNLVLPTIASRCQKVFIHFDEIKQTSILDTVSLSDFNLIKAQIDSFHTSLSYINNSLHEKQTKTINSHSLKTAIEISEKLAKEYSAQILQDLIVFATNERLKKDASFLNIAKSILVTISDWKNSEMMNPSTQLWLSRIFISYQLN